MSGVCGPSYARSFMLFTGAGLACAGASAAAVSIGAPVVNVIGQASGWSAMSIDPVFAAKAMAIGGGSITIDLTCSRSTMRVLLASLRDETMPSCTTLAFGSCTIGLESLTGTILLGYNVDYCLPIAGAGIVGFVALAGAVAASKKLAVFCCDSSKYMCVFNQQGEAFLARIPEKENERLEFFTPNQLRLKCNSVADMIELYRYLIIQPCSNAPPPQLEMQRVNTAPTTETYAATITGDITKLSSQNLKMTTI